MGLPLEVVYFASNEWTAHRQRPHWVADGLAERGARVLFVENLGTRLPRRRDVGRVLRKLRGWARTSRRPVTAEAHPNVTLDAPLVLPLQHVRAVRAVSARLLARRVRRRIGDDRPIVVWTYLPMPVIRDVAALIGATVVVYEWADDASTHVLTPNAAHRSRIAAWEDDMAASADVVFFSSAELLRRRGAVTKNPVLVPHGAPRLDGAEAIVPAEVAELPSPRIGFVGTITEFTDLDLIETLATARPAWSFVLVGPSRVRLDRLRALPNVTLTGEVEHRVVLAVLAAIDAAIIPYRITPAIEVASPVKVHEYLAFGLPVVSVDIPEVRGLEPRVETATGADEFLAALDRAVARARSDAPSTASWDDRVDEMVAHLQQAVERSHTAG